MYFVDSTQVHFCTAGLPPTSNSWKFSLLAPGAGACALSNIKQSGEFGVSSAPLGDHVKIGGVATQWRYLALVFESKAAEGGSISSGPFGLATALGAAMG